MTDGTVGPDALKLLTDVLSEFCNSTNRTYTDAERDHLGARLLALYNCGSLTRESLLSKLEADREAFEAPASFP